MRILSVLGELVVEHVMSLSLRLLGCRLFNLDGSLLATVGANPFVGTFARTACAEDAPSERSVI